MFMTEQNPETMPSAEVKHQPGAAPVLSYRWLVEWGCLLSTVFLAGSTLNCLFQWFSYGKTWDLAATILSLVLALGVYISSFYRSKVASLQMRLLIASGAMAAWAVFLPIVMKSAGFN